MTDAQQNSRPIHSQGLLLAGVAAGVLLLTIYLTSNIIENENGGISAMVQTLGIFLAICSLVKPKIGLFILSAEAFSLDFIKKVAVYYGAVSMTTIIEVLVVGMLAVVGTILGVLIQSVALRQFRLARAHWAILAITAIVGAAIFLATKNQWGFVKAGENAFNGGMYIALALPMTVMLADRKNLEKLINLQFWLAAIWSIWGIRQYYLGFTTLEWFYAETGLSQVASDHMLKFAEPRPFGFGSGAPNYGVISAYLPYGIWRLWRGGPNKGWFLLGTLILFWGTVTSMQRTTMLLPVIVALFYFFFRTRGRTIFVYATSVVGFILCVIFSEELINLLYDINDWIRLPGRWGEQVMVVSTYSDRIYSWMWLKQASTWSLFGVDNSIQTHDVISRIVLSYGAVGLAVMLAALGSAAYFIHRTLLRIEDEEERRFATLMIAVTSPTLILGLTGGGNFATLPINLQIWTFFGAAVAIMINARLVKRTAKQPHAVARRPMILHGMGNPGLLNRPTSHSPARP